MATARALLGSSLLDRSTQRTAVSIALGAKAPSSHPKSSAVIDPGALFFAKGNASAEQYIRTPARHIATQSPQEQPRATEEAKPLFFAKGDASAEEFRPATPSADVEIPSAAPATIARPRLWVRVSPAQRQRVNRTAALLGQSAQAFMRDAVDRFLAEPFLAAAPLHPSMALPPRTAALEPRVKLAITVDAQRQEGMRREAARLGQTMQWCLTEALDRHLHQVTRKLVGRRSSDRGIHLVHDARARDAELPLSLPTAQPIFYELAAG
ncbi:MAG TPA: hypothetical protein VLX09_02310 [Stellaceae bacterium]|nr:hypothetical protein [Stellaceae bacterium]